MYGYYYEHYCIVNYSELLMTIKPIDLYDFDELIETVYYTYTAPYFIQIAKQIWWYYILDVFIKKLPHCLGACAT